MNRERYSDSVRIVKIETHFVETDALNFRTVVQSLTGKNSSIVCGGTNGLLSSSSSSSLVAAAAAETDGGVEAKAGNYYYDNEAHHFHGGVDAAKPGGDDQGMMNKLGELKYEEDDYVLSFMKVNNLSFKDFDRLLSEFALMEELPLL